MPSVSRIKLEKAGVSDAIQSIAERFSAVDPSVPAQLLKSWRQHKLLVRLPQKLECLKNFLQRLARFIGFVFKELQK